VNPAPIQPPVTRPNLLRPGRWLHAPPPGTGLKRSPRTHPRRLVAACVQLGLIGAVVVCVSRGWVQGQPTVGASKAPTLFEDPVIARATGLEIRQSEIDEMYATFRANRLAAGQQIPEAQRGQIKADILEKLVATKLLLRRANDADRAAAVTTAKEFLEEQLRAARTEEAFERQLRVLGMTADQFRTQIREQAIVKAVIDRELKSVKVISETEARKFYDANPKLFVQPEMVKVAHILISINNLETTQPLPPEEQMRKRAVAEKVLARAQSGEDFTGLVREFSEDRNSKDRNGEYVIARDDKRFVLTPEFEGAAFSLAPKQISDVVTSRYGYHILRGIERIPAKTAAFKDVRSRIEEVLIQEKVQKELPSFIETLKAEAKYERLAKELAP
jgi:peptidyl-prolyl cis-trans isomerase C